MAAPLLRVGYGSAHNDALNLGKLWDLSGGSVVIKNPPLMQGTRAQSLVQEDSICCRKTTEPTLWSLRAVTAESTCHNH